MPASRTAQPLPTMMTLITLLLLSITTTSIVSAQPDASHKYHFFCGSSFADIQSDTCADRQWCPSSSDDECLVPGHTCFANTPCDARLITGISVPTYSLSLNAEYRDPTDKMFCGEDYPEAQRVCEAGGEEAIGRHCPDMECPGNLRCYIDMPCSYFVLTNPLAHPLNNVNEHEIEAVDLPDPGSMESNYFCGATFQQAAAGCSSKTWCRSGTSQECPNGQTCFVQVNAENPECEINAITKAEYELAQESAANTPISPKVPTVKPTNSPLGKGDPKNRKFCGDSWNDASDNCMLERFCPNGDGDCPDGLKCHDYTSCDAWGLTFMPSATPTPGPTQTPTEKPINTTPTQTPTTNKPSREPTPGPTGVPTPKPTLPPSKQPTHQPLPYGDFRREFWCGLSWFDAMDNCALKCPSGSDDECPGSLVCLSGVNACKNEMGLGVYDVVDDEGEESEGGEDMMKGDDGLLIDGVMPGEDTSVLLQTNSPTTNKPSRSPTQRPVAEDIVFGTIGNKPSGAAKPGTVAKPGAAPASATVDAPTESMEDSSVVNIATAVGAEETYDVDNLINNVDVDDVPLQGPYEESMVRIILYGIDTPILVTNPDALEQWKYWTKMYMEEFFNNYPTANMLAAGDNGEDTIRNSVFDVTVEITDEEVEMAPVHDVNDLVVGSIDKARNDLETRNRRNLRSSGGNQTANQQQEVARRAQVEAFDENDMYMITYSQTISYRSTLVVINDDPNFIMRHPLDNAEYRAGYVNYLRARDFNTFGTLEYVSRFLYSEFPTQAPTIMPTVKPTESPVIPGEPTLPPWTEEPTSPQPTAGEPTLHPTENFGCNLCRPGQYGLNANVIFNGGVSTCMEVYNWFLENYRQGSGGCKEGQDALNEVCCRDGLPVKKPTQQPTERPVANVVVSEPNPQPNPRPNPPDPTPNPTRRPVLAKPKPEPSSTSVEVEIQISIDESGLPDAASLAETYYCGESWDSVDRNCATATACPSGVSSDCPSGQECIAFTNCGGKFAFVSDPKVEGGGPDPDQVRSTFYCGTSMDFLNMKCEDATPCPNGPEQCEGDGKEFGCFAFTGCNKQVDPGSFVGFLRPPPDNDKAFYCAPTWAELDSRCVNGIPEGARPCPSGDILECEDGHGCFAFACGNGLGAIQAQPAASPTNNRPTSDYSVEDMDLLKSTFFCGTSVEEIDGDCDNAIPCPSGDECPPGYGCFAFSQCGGVDIESLTDTFGQTDRPTRAPTVPIEQICDEQRKMSVHVGYWQSWSIYRGEDCQPMKTDSFDGAPYTHVVYSFASIDSSYRLEAWNGTYDNEVPLYKEFQTVKQRHPGTKTMIAVGGWTHNDPGPMQKRFSQMAASKSNRKTFANSVVQFMRTYGFDGLDLDWEYPGLKDRGGKRDDYDNYVLMTKELREAFDRAPEPYELTVAITGNITKLEMGFDLVGLAKNVDWFNIMAYDLWGSWDPKQIAYSHTDIRMIDEAVEYMSHFIQRSKLVLGLGSYARTYTMKDEDCVELGCPFKGPGEAECEGTKGFLPYFEIADMVTRRDYDTVYFDDETESMVMVTDGNRLISYDNTVSFNRKIQYAEEMCFMGDMLWAIDMLKDGSNPLSSNNGNSAATGDPSDQSFCGTDYQDVISGCKRPCTSGNSDECPPGQQCFANSGCSIDNIGAPPPTKCRLCPDPSTQGMKDWLEIDFDGETMTCGDADMAVISEFAKGSSECDAAKQSLGETCCYNYPDNPCMLCRSETEFMDLRALAEIEFDGEAMTCFDLSKRLGPEEADGDMCSAAQGEHWDTCCYHQCTLCEGKGVKWWNEVEYEEEPVSCGDLDGQLYADETEEGTETCTDVLGEFQGDCCYDYPDDPCDVCTSGGKKLTLMPNEEVEYEGSTFTCAEVNNFLSPFESSSDQCGEVKGLASGNCCFDRCSLCGEGARLDPEIIVDVEIKCEEGDEECEEGATEPGTCADIESGLFQERTTNGDEECTSTRSQHYDACCFEIPSEPCQLCGTEQYMHYTTEIEFNDEDVTCRSASNFLMERENMSSDSCMEAKATLGETCCYEICNICGDYDLDWDVFVNFEGEDMSCGDFNEFFREEAVVDGSEQCEALKSDYFDTCCYSSPTTSCQLCKQGDTFFDLNDNVEVEFNGPTTCYEVANFMSRRTEDTDPVCGVTQTSLFDECCYEKCNLADKPGTYPDWAAEVEMDGNVATCLELEDAIKKAAIPKDSPDCQSLQDAFSPTCSYSIPENACDICPDNAVSIQASAQWNGKEMKCSDIKSRISSREEAESEICVDAQNSLGGECCIDQCEVCDRSQKTDFVMTVYHNGETKQCTEVDTHFYEKSILSSSQECSVAKSEYSDCCYTEPQTPCNLCRRDTEYFDLMGMNSVTYQNNKMLCSEVSDMMFRREEEEGETCAAAKEDLFDACCDTKCSLCAGQGLEAGVKVSHEGVMITCLELDLGLGPASIEANSDECSEITNKYSEDCCYPKPESPCRICPGENLGVNKETKVDYLGTETTCESLSNYLGSREEQQGDACRAASSDHSQDCCFERCSVCGDGKADWETFVTYEGQSIACGDFEWILRGKNIAAGSEQCDAVINEFYGRCCYEPPQTSCNLCHIDGDYLDVSAEVPIIYQGSQMKCLNLYNSLFIREGAESNGCQAAKDSHGQECCFEKCNMCTIGFLDTTATVNVNGVEMSCSALDMSFSKDVVVEGTSQCNQKRSEYADACCYTLPDNPCRVCSAGADVNVDVTVDFYGETKSCGDIGNQLARSEEAGSQACSSTQRDFANDCCFERCAVCPGGYNLNWEVDVEYNRATIACGEFDSIIRSNAIQKGTQECSSLQSTYTSACCYNYATASGVGYATETTLAQVTTTGYLSTNLDTSKLTPSQKEDAKNVFQNLIKNTLESEGVLPKDSRVTVTDIDDNGRVQYEIEMYIDDSVAGAVASSQVTSRPPPQTSSLGDISNIAVNEIDKTLSEPSRLNAITTEIQSKAPQASNQAVANELSSISVTDFTLEQADLTTAGEEAKITTAGTLVTNIDTSNLSTEQKKEAADVVENSIENALQSQGVLTEDDKVTVSDISEEGEVLYEVEMNVDPGNDVSLDDISATVTGIDSTLSDISTLNAISEEINNESIGSSVADKINDASVTGSMLGETTLSSTAGIDTFTSGTLATNIDTSGLTNSEKAEVLSIVENSIKDAIQSAGVLPQEATISVGVTDINDEGQVEYEVEASSDPESALEVAAAIDSTLTDSSLLETISKEIQEDSVASSIPVAQELADATVSGSNVDDTSVIAQSEAELSTSATLLTNLDTSGFTTAEREDLKDIVEDSIKNILLSAGVLPEQSTVSVNDIDDQGRVQYEVDISVGPETALEEIKNAVTEVIDSSLSNASTLEAIAEEIKEESVASSTPVAQELADTSVSGSALGETTVLAPGESELSASGVLETNLDTASLTTEQKAELNDLVESSIENTLQSEGVLSEGDKVTVTNIDEGGEVEYAVDLNVDGEIGSVLEDISNAIVTEIDSTLGDSSTLNAINEEIKNESAGSSVADKLADASISDSTLGETILTTKGDGETEVSTIGTLDTNIDTSSLTAEEKEEVIDVLESSIETSLQSEGVVTEESTVTVTNIDEDGEVKYEIEMSVEPEAEEMPPPSETTTLQAITDAVVGQIDSTLSNSSTLEAISENIKEESAESSVAEVLSDVSVTDFVQGETSVTAGGTATGAGPCNLCKAGEIGIKKDILYNGAQTSCAEVYKFLSTQTEAGSDSCLAGKEALHGECCIRKCDLCAGGGIPDWYAEVNVNGNSMTCLELDGIVVESEIQSGSAQCGQLLEVAAPACCYEPPTKPCNMCDNGSENNEVMSSVTVEYGGSTATCGQIFNTLFSREEHDSETCSLIKSDLASQCCYNKCSLCGGLQINAALSVMHDETELGCSEFDSYIFASNLIEEGTNECTAFQDEHRETCCYDISCSLCAKGDALYTTKETSMVQYGGSEATCGEVSDFLYQQEMSQGNACLAAQENIFSDCCFQQCEICEAGASINWAAITSFNGQSQSCTDVYWLLVSESVEAGTQTCRGLSQVSNDCCYEIPSQQCTLCKDDNGVTYNTRWNKEVTVNGVTKTCGDFNTLLATQEDESETCSMAKGTIFDECCFAGSDTLIAIANQVSTESDAPCSLCQPGQIGINAEVIYENKPTTCEEVYNFLIDSQKESSTTCKAAQVKLLEDCCREPDQLSPSEEPAFGVGSETTTDSASSTLNEEGSVTAEGPKGNEVTPPMDFGGWTRRPSGGKVIASFSKICTALVGVFSLGLLISS